MKLVGWRSFHTQMPNLPCISLARRKSTWGARDGTSCTYTCVIGLMSTPKLATQRSVRERDRFRNSRGSMGNCIVVRKVRLWP
mmetsp:Transcript_9062/g.20099  ORF Transcript_9062/g.20099 Transcript_9062/m.20099 type:complete len:83 (+) Transcript_9062:323-571(+)